MNTVTKVFIILNLILALLVAYVVPVTFAYQENYKKRWIDDTKALAVDLRVANTSALEQSFAAKRYEVALATANNDRVVLQAQKDELQSQILTLSSEKSQLDTQLGEMNATLNAQRDQIQQLNSSLQLERTRRSELNKIAQIARAVTFQLNVKLAEVEDDLNNAETELTRRERTIFDLEEGMKRANAYLALVRTNHPNVYREITSDVPPSDSVIPGTVAAVATDPQGRQDMVMLTIGSDEGLRVGMEFIIYRGDNYICKVRAERVLPDMVACRVIPESWNARGDEIRQGDSAKNRMF